MRFPGGDPTADPKEYMELLDEFKGYYDPDLRKHVIQTDYLFTREWSFIKSESDAFAFLEGIWKMLDKKERRYVYALSIGADPVVESIEILQDQLDAIQKDVNSLLESRERELDKFRKELVPDPYLQKEDNQTETHNEDTEVGNLIMDDVSNEKYDKISDEEHQKNETQVLFFNLILESVQRSLVEERSRIRPTMMVPQHIAVAAVGGAGQHVVYHHNDRIYKLLCLADAVHDFCKVKKQRKKDSKETKRVLKPVDKDLVLMSIGAELPNRVLSPEEHEISFWGNETAVVDYFERLERIPFGDDRVKHILHGRKLDSRFQLDKAMNKNLCYWTTYREQYISQTHPDDPSPQSVRAEVWSHPQFTDANGEENTDANKLEYQYSEYKGLNPTFKCKPVVYMSQIVNVVRSIKKVFGVGELTFIMDKSDDPLSRMVMATSNLDEAMHRLFIVYRGIDHLDDVDLFYNYLDTSETRLTVPQNRTAREGWTYAVCDANIVDGNKHIRPEDEQQVYPNPVLSKRATGPIFCSDDKIQVDFKGIKGDDFDPDVLVSINGVEDLHDDSTEAYSIPRLKDQIETFVEQNRRFGVEQPDISEYLAKKRSCDWGQIQHCITPDEDDKSKYIFVSTDILSCLYGLYRNANVIFMRRPEAKNHDAGPYGVPRIFQNTFTMFRSLTAKEIEEKLNVGGDPPISPFMDSASDTQTGGFAFRYLPAVVLAVTIFASSILGSLG